MSIVVIRKNQILITHEEADHINNNSQKNLSNFK